MSKETSLKDLLSVQTGGGFMPTNMFQYLGAFIGEIKLDGSGITDVAFNAIGFPKITYIGLEGIEYGYLFIRNEPGLTSIVWDNILSLADGEFEISGCAGLTSFSMGSNELKLGADVIFRIKNNPALTSILLGDELQYNDSPPNITMDFSGNALSSASVDDILLTLAFPASGVVSPNLTVDLSGGTNAAPTIASDGAIPTIEGSGGTVITN